MKTNNLPPPPFSTQVNAVAKNRINLVHKLTGHFLASSAAWGHERGQKRKEVEKNNVAKIYLTAVLRSRPFLAGTRANFPNVGTGGISTGVLSRPKRPELAPQHWNFNAKGRKRRKLSYYQNHSVQGSRKRPPQKEIYEKKNKTKQLRAEEGKEEAQWEGDVNIIFKKNTTNTIYICM